VVRGYTRAADLREAVESSFAPPLKDYRLDGALMLLETLGKAMAEPGALGIGARLACSPLELVALRHRAQDRRAEAGSVVLGDRGAEA
jgi:hypothetical protein